MSRTGPSPRAWGELRRSRRTDERARTIPTRVGRTLLHYPGTRPLADHPHARGENYEGPEEPTNIVGPSPRAWGEPIAVSSTENSRRTIPTRVGRTNRTTTRESEEADHPHARGENCDNQPLQTEGSGPSPRAWGELS